MTGIKKTRQEAILRLIAREEIATQEEMQSHLASEGFAVTQATVSRDIRELRLYKATGMRGLCYRAPSGADAASERSGGLLPETVRGVECAGNITVVRTYPGLANAAATYVDSIKAIPILGSVAGDDTVLIVTPTPETAEALVAHLRRIAGLDVSP